MGIFTALALKANSLISEAQLSFAAHQKYIICFFSLWWIIKGLWALFSLLFIFLWNRKPCLDNFMFIITKMLKIVKMNGNILLRYLTFFIISRGDNNCVQRVFEKNIYFIMIIPPILKSYYPLKGQIFVIFLNKRSKGLTMQIHFHSLLIFWSWLYFLLYWICFFFWLNLQMKKLWVSRNSWPKKCINWKLTPRYR